MWPLETLARMNGPEPSPSPGGEGWHSTEDCLPLCDKIVVLYRMGTVKLGYARKGKFYDSFGYDTPTPSHWCLPPR